MDMNASIAKCAGDFHVPVLSIPHPGKHTPPSLLSPPPPPPHHLSTHHHHHHHHFHLPHPLTGALNCTTPPLYYAHLPVSISMNGQDFTLTAHRYRACVCKPPLVWPLGAPTLTPSPSTHTPLTHTHTHPHTHSTHQLTHPSPSHPLTTHPPPSTRSDLTTNLHPPLIGGIRHQRAGVRHHNHR